jgi:chaperonin GroEL (HSP60 family)
LRLKGDGTVGAVLLLEAIRAHATLTLAHRQKGLILRGVSPHLLAQSAVLSQGD